MADPKQDYRGLARQLAERYGLDPNIFERQINQESGFNPNAVSPMGATGIGQFMPPHWDQGQFDPFDPVVSLEKAAQLMSSHLANYGGDISKALAAYNTGRGNLSSFGDNLQEMFDYVRPQATKNGPAGERPWAETQRYLEKILGGTDMTTPNNNAALNKLADYKRQAGGMSVNATEGFIPTMSGGSEEERLGLVRRAIANGGGNPYIGDRLLGRLMEQINNYALFNSMVNGQSTADFLSSGNVARAWDPSALRSLIAAANTGKAEPNFANRVMGGGSFGDNPPGGVGPVRPGWTTPGGTGPDFNPAAGKLGGGSPSMGALERQFLQQYADLGGGSPLAGYLATNPEALMALLSTANFGNAGQGALMGNYAKQTVLPMWQDYGPELRQAWGGKYTNPLNFLFNLLQTMGSQTALSSGMPSRG